MAWNPSPEVAAVRDAANKLESKFAVVIYLTKNGNGIGMASYGATMALCDQAGQFGEYLLEAAERWGTAGPAPTQKPSHEINHNGAAF